LENSKPIIEVFPGWMSDISQIRNYDELPELCKAYVDALERMLNVPISLVSNGPKREQILTRSPKI
jgi:adenylosuccinate synthase